MDDILKQKTIKALEWMTTDAKWRFDQDRDCLGVGSTGGYSPELLEAIEVLEELKG